LAFPVASTSTGPCNVFTVPAFVQVGVSGVTTGGDLGFGGGVGVGVGFTTGLGVGLGVGFGLTNAEVGSPNAAAEAASVCFFGVAILNTRP
jgi:hypothetical protein